MWKTQIIVIKLKLKKECRTEKEIKGRVPFAKVTEEGKNILYSLKRYNKNKNTLNNIKCSYFVKMYI